MKKLLILIFILVSFSASMAQDTTKKPSPYEIKNPSISVVIHPSDKKDNAGINFATQFRGVTTLPDSAVDKREKHLKNIRQLTFEGENAEAYFSPDEKHLSFQARGKGEGVCDQIYTMTLDGKNVKRISTGFGRTTCSYYYPSGDKILYSSTHEMYDRKCPPEPDRSKGYVWPIYKGYDIYIADTNGTLISRLTQDSLYYDAEATISPYGDRIVLTSTRSGGVDLYTCNLNGTEPKRLTKEEGYNGGAYFSPDGTKIVYRASHPKGEELKEFKELLKQGLIRPTSLDIMIMDSSGSNKKQVTDNGKANFCPYFFSNGQRIIFSSNMDDPKGREFDLYAIDTDGKNLERITYKEGFDGFPMFTKDGKHLVWCSNRNGSHAHNTNIFLADWVD
ncbi:MAG: TolB family protein [Candidatus Kapaibacterium sp.]